MKQTTTKLRVISQHRRRGLLAQDYLCLQNLFLLVISHSLSPVRSLFKICFASHSQGGGKQDKADKVVFFFILSFFFFFLPPFLADSLFSGLGWATKRPAADDWLAR